MKINQIKYIEYVKLFAEENKIHIWLSGSFLHENATVFSDVDISVFCDSEKLNDLIYGYGKPIYISHTNNPMGILIVIYEDGVAVDMEIIEKISIVDSEYFHTDDIKLYNYIRETELCNEFSLIKDRCYQTSRLFHRSLIKFLSNKHELGISIANEIAEVCGCDISINRSNYRNGIISLLKDFNDQYQLPSEYIDIIYGLIEKI